MIVVAAALVRPDGFVLMQRRPIGGAHGGLWEFPGGKVEPGELLKSALVREISEELGILVDPVDLVHVARAGPLDDVAVPVVISLYACRLWVGEPLCLEGEEIAWFAPRDIPGLAMPPLDYPLADALILSI